MDYTGRPSKRLRIDDTLIIDTVSATHLEITGEYKFPDTIGTVGQYLTVTNATDAEWQSLTANTDYDAFKTDYDSKVNQNVKTTSNPVFVSTSTDELFTRELQLTSGGVGPVDKWNLRSDPLTSALMINNALNTNVQQVLQTGETQYKVSGALVATIDAAGLRTSDNLELSTFRTKIRGIVPPLNPNPVWVVRPEYAGLITFTPGNQLFTLNASTVQRTVVTSDYFILGMMTIGSDLSWYLTVNAVSGNDFLFGVQFSDGAEIHTGQVGTFTSQYYALITNAGQPSEIYEAGIKTADAVPNFTLTDSLYRIIITRESDTQWTIAYVVSVSTIAPITSLNGSSWKSKQANFLIGDKSNVLSNWTLADSFVTATGYNIDDLRDTMTIAQSISPDGGNLEFKDDTVSLMSLSANKILMNQTVIGSTAKLKLLDTESVLIRDKVDLSKSTPTAALLLTGEWEFGNVLPTDVVQSSPQSAAFLFIQKPRAITSKYYVIPADIAVGGYVQWSTSYSGLIGTQKNMMFGVCFRSSATVLGGFGVGFGKDDYFGAFQNTPNQIIQGGVLQGSLTPYFDPTVGIIRVRVTRTSSVLWTIGYFNDGVALSPTSTFGVSRENQFMFEYAGLFSAEFRAANYNNNIANNFIYNLWNPNNYKYTLQQNTANSLIIAQPNGGELMSVNANNIVLSKPLATTQSITANSSLFNGIACPVTSTFFRGVTGTNLTATAIAVNTDMTSTFSNSWGTRTLTKMVPGASYRVRMSGLIETLANSILKIRFNLGGVLIGESLSITKLSANSGQHRTWNLDCEVIPSATNFSTGVCFVKTTGIWQFVAKLADKDSIEGLSVSSNNGSPFVPITNPGILSVSMEWLSGSTVASTIFVESCEYYYSGFNV